MSKLIAFLVACILSFSASAQDLKFSYGGATLISKERNYTTSAQLQKDARLAIETPGFKLISYVISILPKKEDLIGPFTITIGQDLPQIVKNFLPKATGSKIFLDDIKVQGPDGKVRLSTPYIVVCQ